MPDRHKNKKLKKSRIRKSRIKKLMSQRAKFTKSHFTKSHYFAKSHYNNGGKVIHTGTTKHDANMDPIQKDVEKEIAKLRVSFIVADAVFIGIISYIIFRN